MAVVGDDLGDRLDHGADGVDNDNGKYERGEGVHRAVAFQNAFNHRADGKIALCDKRCADGVECGITDQYGDGQQECGRQDFSDAVNQFARRHRKPVSQPEKKQAEYCLSHIRGKIADQR